MTGKRRAGRDPVPDPDSTPTPKLPAYTPQGVPFTPPPAEPVSSPIPTRREMRQARKKQQRRRVGLLGGTAIVVVAAIVLAGVVFGVHKVATHHHAAARAQTTLLVQVYGSDRTAAGSVLLAHDSRTNSGLEVLIPSTVITHVCGYADQNFANILASPNGAAGSRQAVSAMLGNATIDGSWVIPGSELAALVNKLGGITVDSVDTNVIVSKPGGGRSILVQAGNNVKLNGVQAVAYSVYRATSTENASYQLVRMQNVVEALLRALPSSPTAVEALLREVGRKGSSSFSTARLASFLIEMASDENGDNRLYATGLPTKEIDTGGTPSYSVQTGGATGTKALVASRLSDSVPAGANKAQTTVFLLNGVGTPGLVATACPRLVAHNLTFAGADNAPSFSNAKSLVEVRTDDQVATADRVAKALDLPTSDVRLDRSLESVADVIVTLGSDYKT